MTCSVCGESRSGHHPACAAYGPMQASEPVHVPTSSIGETGAFAVILAVVLAFLAGVR